ncbi:hypothetical protein Heshes_02670 [Alicyclobacillus hesperidum]|uniref:tRNA nucleotidyltransferase (CCA-adding enzyme) n=1 Tax=Alicyclobacillus hesperidum TaxID=89784 RepID=A0AA37U950_9BACL|nr:tRNA cytidylyltransferase [Alicyclobacillus hesperidum]GLV12583.1 hypothetical protein Heshes_02670 [Alicyclobacillus hesperidum]
MKEGRWLVPPAVRPVLQALAAAGHDSYLVGGAVRDIVLGRSPHDLDVATSARPEEIKRLFARTIDTGIRHGTVAVGTEDGWIEVTTFRSDGPYLDGRHPQYVVFESRLESDLARRDFTMNAMALTMDGELVDPFGGRSDLQLGRLACVGDPQRRFREDGLRLMRALRFAVTYDLELAPATKAALWEVCDAIRPVAKERIGQELLRLSEGHWYRRIELLAGCPLWQTIGGPLALLPIAVAAIRQRYRPMQVDAPPPTGLPAIALWYAMVDGGPQHAYQLALQFALGRRQALWLRAATTLIQRLVCDSTQSWSAADLFATNREVAQEAAYACAWLFADTPEVVRGAWRAIEQQPLWTLADLAVSGRELQVLGANGKDIGRLLTILRDAVLAREVANTREALMALAARERVRLHAEKGEES